MAAGAGSDPGSGDGRRLGPADVVVLGLAAVFGAGAFAVWGPAAAAAGNWLPLAVVLAALVAVATATGAADLVAAGTRGRAPDQIAPDQTGPDREPRVFDLRALAADPARLAPAVGRLGAVALLVARVAGAATAAWVFASSVLPTHPLPAAIAVVVVVTALDVVGLRGSAGGAFALVGGIVAVMVVAAVVGLLDPGNATAVASAAAPKLEAVPMVVGGLVGVCGAAGIISFAFAGFSQIAVLTLQAREPAVALRRAVPIALGIAVATYLLVAVALLVGLGAPRLSTETSPLVAVVDAGSAPALGVLVRVGAAVASGAALRSLLVGLSQSIGLLAAVRELPGRLGRVGRRGIPWRADLLGGAAVLVVTALAGQVATMAVAACSVLLAHAVLNVAAARLPPVQRWWPPWTSIAGAVLAVVLAVLLPLPQVVIAVIAIAVTWSICTLLPRVGH